MRKRSLATLPAVAICLVAPTSHAVATNEVVALPAVVVTASPVTQAESVSKDGAESVLVSRAQLALLNAQDLPTALRQVPGVTISRYSPIGSYGGGQGGGFGSSGGGQQNDPWATAGPASSGGAFNDEPPF